ncbi:carboxy-terminal processing protease [Bdellovibrio bacteriovorus W]|nr:carboxy-terminal processing protease [Bdellovibrio bacteriovorus W]
MMKNILAAFLLLSIMVFVGLRLSKPSAHFQNPYPVFCDFVAEKIFISDEELTSWKKTCHSRSRLVTEKSPPELLIKDMNNVLGILGVSHLEIFAPQEVKSIWKGENSETGIEAQFVDSELIVFKVHPASPAADAGIKKGDIVRSINGEQPNPWDVRTQTGIYEVVQGGVLTDIYLKARSIVRAEGISVQRFNDQSAQLAVPSFRSSYFDEKNLDRLREDLKKYKKIVVDLRGNAGGNFVAGLRFLSLFMCESQEVGKLIKPKFPEEVSAELPNTLQDTEQLKVLDVSKEVVLRTYQNSNCYKGIVRVLVDGRTASVAELVAQALKDYRQATVEGAPSRGHLLVGVWYPMPEVGQGVEISIPEAVYETTLGRRIEHHGVEVDRVLYYDIAEMQAGIDSWVKNALD